MPHFSSERQRYEHLRKEIAGQLLRENSVFQNIKELQLIVWEYQKLAERQRHLEELELKIKAVISVINDLNKDEAKAKAKVVEEEKQLRSYSKELGQSVFAGFKAGDISYYAIFEPRKTLQDRIEELEQNKNNLSNFESLPLFEKLKKQAQYLVIVGKLKVEELKAGFADRSLGEAILDSDEALPLKSTYTEAVLKSIEEQKRKIKNAKDKAVQMEKLSMERKAECAFSLGRLNIHCADLKAEQRELQVELKANMTRQTKLCDEALDFAIGASEAFVGTPIENKLPEIKLLRKTGTVISPNINNLYYSAKDRILNLPKSTKRSILAATGILIGLLFLSFILRPSMHQRVELSGQNIQQEMESNQDIIKSKGADTFTKEIEDRIQPLPLFSQKSISIINHTDTSDRIEFEDFDLRGHKNFVLMGNESFRQVRLELSLSPSSITCRKNDDRISAVLDCWCGNPATFGPFDPEFTPRISLSIRYESKSTRDGSIWFGKPGSQVDVQDQLICLVNQTKTANIPLIKFDKPKYLCSGWAFYPVSDYKLDECNLSELPDRHLCLLLGQKILTLDNNAIFGLYLFDRAIGVLRKKLGAKTGRLRSTILDTGKAEDTPKEITNSIGMKLVRIPKGKFLMGSPETEAERSTDETQHEVILTQDFYLGVYEVTQAEYEKVMGDNPSESKGARKPVENVSWNDASEFCKKLSELPEEKKAGRVYRLPTEAQWEYACRAGTTTPFHFGSQLNGTQANCNGRYPYGTTIKGPYLEKTSPVGSYPSNGLGLHDMHGNVAEWCLDWQGGYGNNRVEDPQGAQLGVFRALRGGSWNSGFAESCRAACRGVNFPGYRGSSIGFRVLLPLAF